MPAKQEDSLKHQVYHALFSDIIKGVYPFDYIFTEKFLIEKYKVSRAPVREALTMLTENQILVSIPRQGYKFMQPSEGNLFEIVKFRSALECSFLENYHCYIKKADIESLWTLCDRYDAIPPSESLTRWSTNCEFHLKLFTLYGNGYARRMLENAMNIQTLFYALKMKSHIFTVNLHRAMMDYLEKGQISTASQLLKADIESILCVSPWIVGQGQDRE